MGRKGKQGDGGAQAPQKPKTTVESLSDDQLYSLTEQHRKTYEVRLAAKKAADKALQDIGKIIKADLGPQGMMQIKTLIEGSTPEGEAAIKARIESDAQVLRWLGVPIGTQADMFPSNDRTPLADRAYAEGKRQGLAGESCNNPHHHATEAHRMHNDGYEEGQATLRAGFKQKVDDTPKGSVPRDQWQQRTREDNEAVEKAIKTGTVHQLGTKTGASAAADSLVPTH
jgi:hypothetical protein